ncbi:hypothetical protein LJY25_13010 [Hymenobacter sp. BT175]|uniref:pectate lyase family protein n=1 Tax=Hymenobacter translucens TaxID=2886507 RepID=UPI001D0E11BD|nr:hypothetical protein [Hymenobacter translucens]MCC2547368.1 hypothetical protein [Hymenobacter translucens]
MPVELLTSNFLPRVTSRLTMLALLGSLLLSAACTKETPEDSAVTPPPTPDAALMGYASLNGSTVGGAAGNTVTATTLAELTSYAQSSEPLVIKIDRKISAGTAGASVAVKSNKTLLGVGSAGFLEGVGLSINGQKNVIVRNLKFTMSTITPTGIDPDSNLPTIRPNAGDCLTIQGASTNVWVDHCEFFNIDPAVQTNKDLYDGLLDIRDQSAFITVSWSYFHDHHKASLVGSSDTDNFDRKVTFHHNHYFNIGSRTPLFRFGSAHLFNNYYNRVIGQAIDSRSGACLRIEKNYFEGTKNPVISTDGTGTWELIDNNYTNSTGTRPTASTCTPTLPYTYTSFLTPATVDVKNVVLQGAGVGKL